jgi:hypothetical protein
LDDASLTGEEEDLLKALGNVGGFARIPEVAMDFWRIPLL